eukprot:gene13512-19375_t
MAAVQSMKAQFAVGSQRSAIARPVLASRRPVLVKAQKNASKSAQVERKAVLAATVSVATTTMLASSAQAAELVQLAAGDSRILAIAGLFVPALGWVAFNAAAPLLNQLYLFPLYLFPLQPLLNPLYLFPLQPLLNPLYPFPLQPLLNQYEKMDSERKGVIAVGTGLAAASLLVAEQANAAAEIAQLAGDSRILSIGGLFVPALGWVAFNAAAPLIKQYQQMDEQRKTGLAIGTGLTAASLFFAEQAEAATEVAQLAGDSRILSIAALFVPALAWVAFNAAAPLMKQYEQMDEQRNGALAIGTGLAAASLLFAEQAEAATEVAQLAGDSRFLAIGGLFVPALAWVAFNAAAPLLKQFQQMDEGRKGAIAVGTGLGAAASLLVADQAQAASVYADIAAGDNRISIILALFVPALGWVAFNALQPLLTQINTMAEDK